MERLVGEEGTTLTASAQVSFQAPGPGTTPTPGPAPQAPIARTPTPRLTISKVAPTRSAILRRVNYVITVRNPTRTTVRSVVLRDRLPRASPS